MQAFPLLVDIIDEILQVSIPALDHLWGWQIHERADCSPETAADPIPAAASLLPSQRPAPGLPRLSRPGATIQVELMPRTAFPVRPQRRLKVRLTAPPGKITREIRLRTRCWRISR